LPTTQAQIKTQPQKSQLNADLEDCKEVNIVSQSRKSSDNGGSRSADKEGGTTVQLQQASCIEAMKQKLRGSAHRYNQINSSDNDMITEKSLENTLNTTKPKGISQDLTVYKEIITV